MAVPYLGNALKGWARETNITIITQTVVDHETVETESDVSYPANFQPMPAAKVNRKPPEQRTWKWWSVIIKDDFVLFQTDDIIQELTGTRRTLFGFVGYDAAEPYDSNVAGFISYDDTDIPVGRFLRYTDNQRSILEPGRKFRIEQANDWRESGFTKYEVVEDYT